MKIDSPRFGTLDIEADKIITFPRGLAGFEECRRYSIFHPEGVEPKFFILQSIDDPAVAFYLADPDYLGCRYEIELSAEEAGELGLEGGDATGTVVAVMLSRADETAAISANLNTPLVFNLALQRGIQHVLPQLDYRLAEAA